MVVWAVMIPLFVGVTRHSLRLVAPEAGITRLVSNWTVLIVALWYVAVVAAIWFEFGTGCWGHKRRLWPPPTGTVRVIVELPGIEPGSSGAESGLLRVQSV